MQECPNGFAEPMREPSQESIAPPLTEPGSISAHLRSELNKPKGALQSLRTDLGSVESGLRWPPVTLPSQRKNAENRAAALEYGMIIGEILDNKPRSVTYDGIYKSTNYNLSPDKLGNIRNGKVGSFPKTGESDILITQIEGAIGYRTPPEKRAEARVLLEKANELRTPRNRFDAALDEVKELRAEREKRRQQACLYADQVASARAEVESVQEQIESVERQLANLDAAGDPGAGGQQPSQDPTALRRDLENLLQRLARAKADLKDAMEQEKQNEQILECLDRLLNVVDEVERYLRLGSIGEAVGSDDEDGEIEVAVICECNRRLRVKHKANEEASITCGHCGTPFRADPGRLITPCG